MNDSLIYVWLIGQPPKLSTFRANRKVLPSLIGQTPWPEFLFRTSGFTKESFKSGLLTLTITLENPASWDDGKPFSWRVPKIWQYQGGITCGAIDEPWKSSKAIDGRVIINFRDKNVVIAHFRDKNGDFILFIHIYVCIFKCILFIN